MRRLALLLLPEFSNLGLAAVTEPLFVANWLAQRPLFEWKFISADGKPVRASNGTIVAVAGDLTSIRECASVFVLASFEPLRTARNGVIVRCLKRLARAGIEIGGIENGSLALAQAGLLDEHPAAIHWDNLAGFQELFPKVPIAQQAFSFTRNRATCAGAAATLEMMVAWISQRADSQIADEVAKHLLLGAAKSAAIKQMPPSARARTGLDDSVIRARAVMQDHIDDPLPCRLIAQRLGVSLRQLERRFSHSLGRTLNSEYMLVRVEKAHQYLQQTALSVTEVAALTGFSSAAYFSKVYRRTFQMRPSDDRRQSTDAPVFRRRSKNLTT
jgi:AraC family carnitine catabolism transcriptional activator